MSPSQLEKLFVIHVVIDSENSMLRFHKEEHITGHGITKYLTKFIDAGILKDQLSVGLF
jgi:hypothetical protein